MTKQVHIHIHRTKARDAGEGKGKWITLSPSGTHVKVDGKGEITAGPKGMAGKKPSELSKKSGSTPAPGKNSEPSTQQVAKHAGKKVQPSKPGWALRADPVLAAKFEAAEARSKAKKLERETGAPSAGKPVGFKGRSSQELSDMASTLSKSAKTPEQHGRAAEAHAAAAESYKKAAASNPEKAGELKDYQMAHARAAGSHRRAALPEAAKAKAPDPIKQARQFEEQASKLHQQAQAEYQKNGPSDEHARLKREAQKATNQGTDLMVQAEAAARTSKPGPDGKPMGIHPALAAVTPPGFPTPGSQEGNKVRVNQATGELSQVGKPAVLSGVNAFSPPKSTSAQISASMVTYRSNTTGAGTAPKDKSQYGNWLFDSAPGSLADHSRTGGTFAISGTYAEAEQKAKQQAAAWGHSQLRLAP